MRLLSLDRLYRPWVLQDRQIQLDLEYLERLYSLLGLVVQSNLFDLVFQVRLEVPDRL